MANTSSNIRVFFFLLILSSAQLFRCIHGARHLEPVARQSNSATILHSSSSPTPSNIFVATIANMRDVIKTALSIHYHVHIRKHIKDGFVEAFRPTTPGHSPGVGH
ncbi:unnamed protein product [Linum trigynum]|uniref:Uncharacterized protein n=1 Tax=Linum trigynum TaxID=586398 RepID=A0AAV2GEQ1_9ROSI